MAIKQIRQVPSKLPAAHLFLDDVEEIVSIIAQLPGYGRSKPDPSTIKYRVGERVCDTIEDLKQIGGKTRNFGIDAESGHLTIATYESSFHAYAAREEAWKAYGKVRVIFEQRSSGVFNTLRNAPSLAFLLLFVLCFTPVFTWRLVTVRPVYHYSLEIFYWILLGTIFNIAGRRHSTVELRYFDEVKTDRSKELRPLVWSAIVGAIVGSVATVLAERIVKWLWP